MEGGENIFWCAVWVFFPTFFSFFVFLLLFFLGREEGVEDPEEKDFVLH